MPKVQIQCPCGKTFESWPNHKRKFCSHVCYAKSIEDRKMPWLEPRYKTNWQKTVAHKISASLKGKKRSETHRKNISLAKIGKPAWNKGLPGLRGKNHPGWKGGERINESGYRLVWVAKKKYRLEHILVMEQYLGRKLQKGEIIHHKNGDKLDNRIENLQLFENHQAHAKHHYHSGKWLHLKHYTPSLPARRIWPKHCWDQI